VIPQGNDKVLEVDCKIFAEAVDRVATISTEKSRAVKLTLNNGTLVLSATSPEAGKRDRGARGELHREPDRDRLQLALPARQSPSRSKATAPPSSVMADSASPTVVRDLSDTTAIYVLMPMRV